MYRSWSTLKKLIYGKMFANGSGGTEIWRTITAAIATFTAVPAPLRQLSVAVEPVQNLNGYDNPWPAGGGKNKYNPDEAQNNKWINSTTGAIESTNGYWVTGFIPVKSGDVIRCTSKGSSRNAWYNTDKSQATHFAYSGAGHGVTAPADGYVVITIFANTIAFGADFIVTINNDDITFQPYSNICPITGWDSVNIWVQPTHDTSATPTATIQLGETVYGGTLDVVNGKMTVDKGIITLNGTEIWGSSYRYGQGFFTQVNDVKRFSDYTGRIVCNRLTTYPSNYANSYISAEAGITAYTYSSAYVGQNWIYAKGGGATTSNEFKTWLSSNNLQVVYPLATPIEIPLTPEQISTLQGTNNVWSDAGDVTVEYRAR